MKRWSVFLGVWMRNIVQLRRYYFNTVSSLVTLYIIFLFIFYGTKALGGVAVSADGTLEGMIVGYFLWANAMFAYSDLSWGLTSEAQVGTLEQLYLSPFGFGFVNACSTAVNFIVNILCNVVLLLAAMATTGKWLRLDVVSILPLLLLTLAGAYGIGFALGGLALIFKRIQATFQIVQFVFIGFLLAPMSNIPATKYLPLAMGNILIQRVMVNGFRLWQLPLDELGVAAATGVVYLGLGLTAFAWASRVARNRGLLGQY